MTTPIPHSRSAEPRPDQLFSLHNRTALITGASRGIGAAAARTLAAAGAHTILLARSQASLQSVAEQIHDAGGRATVVVCDLTDPTATTDACANVLDLSGGVDILVNNAGGPVFQADFRDVRDDGWEKVMNLNLTSTMRVTREIGRVMVERQRGSVINISSIGALQEWPEITAYCAAKTAMLSLTRSLAAAWAPSNVRVNAICPGWIDTDINRAYTADPARRAQTGSYVPLGGWAGPESMSGTILWLAADASSFITGAVIPADGGASIGLPASVRAHLDPKAVMV